MHVSLDSALGRQRRLNSVGESVLQIAPNAAAAYSLRSLTGGSPKVVRVRRASDNGERDFTSAEINSGEMVSWVNQQTIAPLDIQALEADGRTGDFLIAKAAYSLRSLGTRQATLAATGDTVSRADGKFVVQVRRSSDDALKSFTAAEITDGTLLAFVNEPNVTTVNTQDFTDGSSWSETGGGSARFTTNSVTGGTGPRQVLSTYQFKAGTTYKITLDGNPSVLNTSNCGVHLQRVSDSALTALVSNRAVAFNLDTTFTPSDNSKLRIRTELGTADWTYSNFTVQVVTSDGHVKTWYDQSVTNEAGDTATGNHATQATAASQPKIVSAGSLVTGGIAFDGTDDFLKYSGNFLGSSSASSFSVSNFNNASASSREIIYGLQDASGNRYDFLVARQSSNVIDFYVEGDSESGSSLSITDTDKHLLTAIYADTEKRNIFDDGALGHSFSNYNQGALTDGTDFLIGQDIANSNRFNGSIAELIVYNTDQTDNRTALEANIGEAYSITGIPAYDNEVDGFVETWYDQSGNGKDATQATAASQPKIVDAGALVTSSGLASIEFDGTNDALFTLADIPNHPLTLMAVSKLVDGSSPEGGIVSVTAGTTSYNALRVASGTFTFVTRSPNLNEAVTLGSTTSPLLITGINKTASSAEGFKDGTSAGTLTGTTDNWTSNYLLMGALRFSGGNTSLHAQVFTSEVIVYASDQSTNRVAIETNINGHYSIF